MGRPSKSEQQARRAVSAIDATSQQAVPAPGADVTSSSHSPRAPAERSESGESDPTFDPLVTIDQLALWLGKPKGTLYQWRCRNFGPRGIKVGNDVRYRRSEVEAYLDAHTDRRDSA